MTIHAYGQGFKSLLLGTSALINLGFCRNALGLTDLTRPAASTVLGAIARAKHARKFALVEH